MDPRRDDKWKTFVVYSPDGLLSDPLEKLTKDYLPLMNTFKLVVANELGIDRFDPRQLVPGEDESPILFRHVRDIIRKEQPGNGHPKLPHQLKADFPKLYTSMCQYIRQQVSIATNRLGEAQKLAREWKPKDQDKKADLENLAVQFDQAQGKFLKLLIDGLSASDVADRRVCAKVIADTVVPAIVDNTNCPFLPEVKARLLMTLDVLMGELRPPRNEDERLYLNEAAFFTVKRLLRIEHDKAND